MMIMDQSSSLLKGFGLARIPILATAYGPVYTDSYVAYNAYSGYYIL